ncbi:Holliday junction resolvase RecU [Senegalia massiliensis]|uniref:Holliday junction resolvase RecU n=1 Tax=Senegalia massiliensis TaxID=1720316 RepID=A0A845R1G7_9CLOT|nr:Holliday junction resolvase RecU [Senegalia massiliensis]NBI08260.1 Holliday junction resolvase RecU [Senegalia massiliensis]
MGIHRGDTFEEIINISNVMYKRKGIALIQKIATPVKVLRRQGHRITNGYFEQKSTLDFIGTYRGRPIAFDAKETKENRFPLKNIHEHQLKFMESWHRNGGQTFILVSFASYNKVYKLDYKDLIFYWDRWKRNKGRRGYASIPYEHFKLNCKELASKDGILLDYLEGVEGNEKSNCG